VIWNLLAAALLPSLAAGVFAALYFQERRASKAAFAHAKSVEERNEMLLRTALEAGAVRIVDPADQRARQEVISNFHARRKKVFATLRELEDRDAAAYSQEQKAISVESKDG
jgi:hypothetical protein